MSTIGTGGLGFPLTSSVAGAAGQQRLAGTNQSQAEAAARKFAADQAVLAAKARGDIGASEQTGDRDADGRQPWAFVGDADAEADGKPFEERSAAHGDRRDGQRPPRGHAPDPDHERGTQLDLDA